MIATPMNTMGMGAIQPMVSDPLPVTKSKRKKMKSLVKYLTDKVNK